MKLHRFINRLNISDITSAKVFFVNRKMKYPSNSTANISENNITSRKCKGRYGKTSQTMGSDTIFATRTPTKILRGSFLTDTKTKATSNSSINVNTSAITKIGISPDVVLCRGGTSSTTRPVSVILTLNSAKYELLLKILLCRCWSEKLITSL